MANRSLRLQIDTQENLSDEEVMKIMSKFDQLGYFCFLVGETEIKAEDLINLPKIEVEKGEKTPSQRLRNRLFVWYKKTHTNKDDFNAWYTDYLEKLGDKFLEKIN